LQEDHETDSTIFLAQLRWSNTWICDATNTAT